MNRRRPGGLTGLVSRLLRPGGVNAPSGVAPRPRAAAGPPVIVRSKALSRFLEHIGTNGALRILDLGPVIGSNITFLGERVDCKIHVEDLYADLDRAASDGTLESFAEFLSSRLPHADATIDAALCWDLFDYLDRAAAEVLAREVVRMLRPGALLLAFFGGAKPSEPGYTRYVISGDDQLQYDPYRGTCRRGAGLGNREIVALFPNLSIVESVVLSSGVREMVFARPLEPSTDHA